MTRSNSPPDDASRWAESPLLQCLSLEPRGAGSTELRHSGVVTDQAANLQDGDRIRCREDGSQR